MSVDIFKLSGAAFCLTQPIGGLLVFITNHFLQIHPIGCSAIILAGLLGVGSANTLEQEYT